MREHGIERARAVRMRGQQCLPIGVEGQAQHEEHEAGRGCEAHDDTVALEERTQRAGPRVLAVGCAADLGHHLRKIELELVRRRVWAGVIARAAVVAQIGHVGEIALGERDAPLERGKDSAVPFAIAAGIADARHALALRDESDRKRSRRRHGVQPPRQRSARTRFQSPCRCPRCSPCRARCRP